MKKTSSSKPPVAITAAETKPFGQTFTIKGETVIPEAIIPENAKVILKPFKNEEEYLRLIMHNRVFIFGLNWIGLNPKGKKSAYPWDAFLFDMSDAKHPRCFMVKAILSKEDFSGLVRTMTGIFAFLQQLQNRRNVVTALSRDILSDKRLTKIFLQQTGNKNWLDEMLQKTIEKAPQVLLLTDEGRPYLSELMSAYPGTWVEMLRIIYLRKYQVGKSQILSMYPSLNELNNKPKVQKEKVIYTEANHFENTSEVVRSIYLKIQMELKKVDKSLQWNVQKFYVSLKKGRNLAFFHLRRKALYLVVMNPEKDTRKVIKNHTVKELPISVKKFWNGDCCAILIDKNTHLSEVVGLLKKMIK